MNIPSGNGTSADKIAESAYLRLASRVSMIVASLLLPIAGFFLIQTLNTIKEVRDQMVDVRIVSGTVQTQVAEHERRLNDQDRRLFTVEGYIRRGP